ncbi:hypothetical protein BCR43DRAFT_94083 [Syncephalastrum racemosum]|uniref:Uncharacterized protein n=1 Tax=Syncephalastrum racemosum TaxID=13706 RepID=A0A1X2H0Z7_SYNRA|nr:hypothetical protein BCR43DRAFT_94083 [Syncephalastrum racemosum]
MSSTSLSLYLIYSSILLFFVRKWIDVSKKKKKKKVRATHFSTMVEASRPFSAEKNSDHATTQGQFQWHARQSHARTYAHNSRFPTRSDETPIGVFPNTVNAIGDDLAKNSMSKTSQKLRLFSPIK